MCVRDKAEDLLLDGCGLRALRQHCITHRHDSVIDITKWAQEYFQKLLSVKWCPVCSCFLFLDINVPIRHICSDEWLSVWLNLCAESKVVWPTDMDKHNLSSWHYYWPLDDTAYTHVHCKEFLLLDILLM